MKRFLIAGVMEGTQRKKSDKGTPQGGQISPVLANVSVHDVLDLWYGKVLQKKCKGEVYYVRYADDFLLMFQYENEARLVMDALKIRLGKFGLELAEDKTRILPIGRFKGTKEDFDFLGFTFFNTKTRGGHYRLGVRTSKKKLKAKKQAVKAWLHDNMHQPVSETHSVIATGAFQLLRGERQSGATTEVPEIRAIHLLPHAQSKAPEAEYEMGHVSQNLGLLCEEAAPDKGYLELETDAGLKSRMRENRTYGSMRGSRQAFHTAKYLERSVELVYSTE